MSTHTKNPSEVEAVNQVHQALEPFDPVARSRILRAVTSLLEVASNNGDRGFQIAPNPSIEGARSTITNTNTTSPLQTKIDAFISERRPANTYQRLACLAYYLEHHDQKTDFTGKDLDKANSDARQPRISNMSMFLNDATNKYGFFTAVGGGKKRLTSRGAAVVQALPDQAAVKQALQNHLPPRRSGRRPKAKSK
jgi:hypothetical protein